MRFVDQQVRAVGAAHGDDFLERRHVAADRVEALDDDQPVTFAGRQALELLAEALRRIVPECDNLRRCLARRVVDARVAVAVDEDDVVRAAVRVIRERPELRAKLWANIAQLRSGLQQMGYLIGATESPIVPIFTGEETRTIALWQELLAAGLYVNLIVPPGCPRDECLLRASCSAAHTPQQIATALEIFERARVGVGVTA